MARTKGHISNNNKKNKVVKKPTRIIVNGHVLTLSQNATCWICNDDVVINDPEAKKVKEAFSKYDIEYEFENLAVTNLVRKLENDREEYKKRLESVGDKTESSEDENDTEDTNCRIYEDPDHQAFIFS